MARPILLATRSPGKLDELGAVFTELRIPFTDLRAAGIEERPEEDRLEKFATFEENALAKARYFHRLSGIPTIGDDSGLVVEALGGEPGVLTKRWSGRTDLSGRALDLVNNKKLVREIQRLESEDASVSRAAKYVCVAAYVDDGFELARRGEIAGTVIDEPRGLLGFGYDPHFHAPDLGGTFAESSLENTAKHSHRSRAIRALLAVLREEGRSG